VSDLGRDSDAVVSGSPVLCARRSPVRRRALPNPSGRLSTLARRSRPARCC